MISKREREFREVNSCARVGQVPEQRGKPAYQQCRRCEAPPNDVRYTQLDMPEVKTFEEAHITRQVMIGVKTI